MTALTDPRDGSSSRDLVALALDVRAWSPDRALEIGGDPSTALARLDAMAVPAREVEPNGLVGGRRGPKTDRLMQALRVLGVKIDPRMGAQQVDAWIGVMVIALSDLPFAFSIRGAAAAIHTPMKFLNEVEAVVREKADEFASQHRLATQRLKSFQRGLDRQQPALPRPEPRELTAEDIAAMPESLRALGVKLGYIEDGEA